MPERPRVQMPDKDGERPRAGALVALALSGLTSGILIAYATEPARDGLEADEDEPDASDTDVGGAAIPRLEIAKVHSPRKPRPRHRAAAHASEGLSASGPPSDGAVPSGFVDAGTEGTAPSDAQVALAAALVSDAGLPMTGSVTSEGQQDAAPPPAATPPTALATPALGADAVPPPAALPTTIRERPDGGDLGAAPPVPAEAAEPAAAPRTPDLRPAKAAPAPAAKPKRLRMKPGIVAYVRCDGLPRRKGPYPCPRDLRLERRVWRVLRRLEHCADAYPGVGEGQIKLDFRKAWLLGYEVNARDGALDRAAVETCAGPGLSRLRTKLRPLHMTVSFRFKLTGRSGASRNPK